MTRWFVSSDEAVHNRIWKGGRLIMTATPPPSPAASLGDFAACPSSTRSRGRAWWTCGLLMLATVVNSMDRQALSVTARWIKSEMGLMDFHVGLAIIGWIPLASWVVLWRFWPGS
jgi:hypothetical protein